MRVITKAYADRPLDRVVVGAARKVIYIATQSVADAMEPGELGGVGFPRNAVFKFDAALYDSLCAAWNTGDEAGLARLWASATPVEIAATVPA